MKKTRTGLTFLKSKLIGNPANRTYVFLFVSNPFINNYVLFFVFLIYINWYHLDSFKRIVAGQVAYVRFRSQKFYNSYYS